MFTNVFLVMAILSLLPVSELRGAIPYGLAHGLPVAAVYPYCVFLNALIGPVVYIFLASLHKLFIKMNWYQKLFDKIIRRARSRMEGKVERFGYLGVILFVAIPFPVTGAYTGTLGAWILGLEPRKTFLAVAGGVIISGIVVSLVSHFGIEALSFFIKGRVD